MGALKQFNSQIGNIDNEGRFLYKIRHSGPWCAAPPPPSLTYLKLAKTLCLAATHSQSPNCRAVCETGGADSASTCTPILFVETEAKPVPF